MLETGQLPLHGDALAWFRQGLLLASSQDYEQAVLRYNQVLQVRPDCFEVWYERGLALENLGIYQNAIASYNKALQLRPPQEVACEIWHHRGEALQYGLGDYEAAIASYDKVLLLKPEHYQAWQNRGNALMHGFHQYEPAIASYDKALWLKPDSQVAWCNRGNALVELERYPEAIASYDRALELEPNDPIASYGRTCALERSGLAYKEPTTNPAWYGRGFSEDNPLEDQAIANKTDDTTAQPSIFQTDLQPKLVLEDEQGRREISLDKAFYTVGRDPKCDLRLYSQFVSRQHATIVRLSRTDGTYIYQIMDGTLDGKRSTNGLLINGRKRQVWDLSHDDLIIFSPEVRAIYVGACDRNK